MYSGISYLACKLHFSAPHYAAMYGMSGSTTCFHILIDDTIFEKN